MNLINTSLFIGGFVKYHLVCVATGFDGVFALNVGGGDSGGNSSSDSGATCSTRDTVKQMVSI